MNTTHRRIVLREILRDAVRLLRGSRWMIGLALMVLTLPYALLSWLCDSGIKRLISISAPLTSSHALAHAIGQLPGFFLGLAWTPIFYVVFTLLYLKLVEQIENVSLPDLLNGALAAKRPKPDYDEGPAPWGEPVDIPSGAPETGKNPVSTEPPHPDPGGSLCTKWTHLCRLAQQTPDPGPVA